MVKIILFIFLMFIILLFPIYENGKITINSESLKNSNISLAEIKNGNYYIYDVNLAKKGTFTTLNIYKNYYKAENLYVNNLLKQEKYFSYRAFLKKNILKLYNFKYKNSEYSLYSNYVVDNLDTKNIKGNRFFLYSKEYNGTGRSFFINSSRDINASFVSFNLKTVDKK